MSASETLTNCKTKSILCKYYPTDFLLNIINEFS